MGRGLPGPVGPQLPCPAGIDPLRHQVHGTGQSRCLRPWSRPHCAETGGTGGRLPGRGLPGRGSGTAPGRGADPHPDLRRHPGGLRCRVGAVSHYPGLLRLGLRQGPLGPGTRDGRHLDRPYSV